jgi:hypothetical protein
MAEEPQPLTAESLEGMERIRVARRMKDPVTGARTGPQKVWTTSVFDIIGFARKNSTTVKSMRVEGATLIYSLTNGEDVEVGLVNGKDGSSIHAGFGPPAQDFGAPGDAYIDAATGDVYRNLED